MRMTEHFVATELFANMHFVHVKCLVFRLRCISHRLMCFGFEKYINTYSPRELVMLAALMQGVQHNACLMEAYKKGDRTIKAWIEKTSPEILPAKMVSK